VPIKWDFQCKAAGGQRPFGIRSTIQTPLILRLFFSFLRAGTPPGTPTNFLKFDPSQIDGKCARNVNLCLFRRID
jgi:hypothetical protein